MELIKVSFDTTVVILFAKDRDHAMKILSEDNSRYKQVGPHNKWVYYWEVGEFSDITIEETDQEPGIIFQVTH